MSEPYTISALLTPVLGSLVDRHGGRAFLVVVSSALLCVSHVMLAATRVPAQLLLLGVGTGYAVFASVIWPAIPAVVGRRQLGTAYGLVTTLQNLGLFVLPLIVGLVLDVTTADAPLVDPNPYAGVEMFFASLGGAGVLIGLLLNTHAPTRIALNSPGGTLAHGYTPLSTPEISPEWSPQTQPCSAAAGTTASLTTRSGSSSSSTIGRQQGGAKVSWSPVVLGCPPPSGK